MDEGMQKNICKCPHHKVVPFMVVLFGLLFLLKAFYVFDAAVVDVIWPILVLVAGLTKLFEDKCKCC